MQHKLKLSTISLAIMAFCTTTAFAASPPYLVKENQNANTVADYWTPERMQNAKPMLMLNPIRIKW